ncbi:MAG: T9SS type A sorting domain-containing protein [Bacteroidia bacterium]
MKLFKKTLAATALFACGICIDAIGVNYVPAAAGSADWNTSSSWSPAGIPGASDNVTITAGSTITLAAAANCNNLTVNGTISYLANIILNVKGNYVVSATGSETGIGIMQFAAPGTTISVAAGSGSQVRYAFTGTRTILAGSVISKLGCTPSFSSLSVTTNLGSFVFGTVISHSTAKFINGTSATLDIRKNGFFAGSTLDCSANNNTVILNYGAGNVPLTIAGANNGYYNLTIATSAGTKTILQDLLVRKNLTLGSTLTFNSNNFNITVNGNWSSSATFVASAGKSVTFSGTTSQTVSNTSGTTTFKRLVINNTAGVTLTSGTYNLNEVLTVSNGTFNTGGRPFTMTSTAAQTARIAPIAGTGAIAGNFTIQRFITARDTTWADLSSPVQSTTFNDWDNELPAVSYTDNPPNDYASAATYDEMADAYVPVTSSGTSLNAGQGFEVFLSGDYSYANFPATTLTTVGVPNQGDFDLSSSVSNTVQGWNLVGNPFASSISWSSVYTASGGAGSGMYDYFEMYDYTIADWNGYTSASGQEIGSTQGFWVYGLAGPMTLIIPESAKTTSSNSSLKAGERMQPYFTLKLSSTTSKAAHIFKVSAEGDGIDALDSKDIPFHKSINATTPEMYTMLEGKKINIFSFNSANENYSIPLRTKVSVAGKYRLDPAGYSFIPEYTCVKLLDKQSGEVIDLNDGNGYCFMADPNDNPDRFTLVLSKDSNCKSSVASSTPSLSNEVEILPNATGNTINFSYTEAANTNISVINMLGQNITETMSVNALDQSVNITLPEGFNGMYIVKVESAKGAVTKKFVKK